MTTPIIFKKKNPKAAILTKYGNIEIRFFYDLAPRHVDNFINLTKAQFYNGTTFHRVVPGFVIQGGDPFSKEPDRKLHGTGGPGFSLPPETSDRPHERGIISMAKMPRTVEATRDVSDNGSQFFICVEDQGSLDRTYSVFGKVVKGMETVDKIVSLALQELADFHGVTVAQAEKLLANENGNPLEPVEMTIVITEE